MYSVVLGLAEQVVGHLDEIICGAGVVQCEVKELNAAIHEFLRSAFADFIGIHFVSLCDIDAAVCIVAGFLIVTATVRGEPAAFIEPRPVFGILDKLETGVEVFVVFHCESLCLSFSNHAAFAISIARRWWKINADSESMQDFSAGNRFEVIAHEGGIGLGNIVDGFVNGIAQDCAFAADFIEQGVGFCVGHRDGEAGLGAFGIVFHLDGDEDILKLIHGSSLSNHIFVGLAEHGQVNGITGNFHLNVLHRGAVGEVGGGENGGSDDGEGGEGADDGLFHGGLPFFGKMGIKIAPLFVEKDAFGWYNLVVNIL